MTLRACFHGVCLACRTMASKRVHIVSAVNAGAVSKSGSTYTIRDVCGAVDGIVMHNMVYEGEQLAAGARTLEGKPAPAGHPKNSDGQFVSALDGEALLNSYAGAVCRNARHEGGRTLVDVVVNEAQAKAHPDGAKLLERLDAAITGTNAEPIHVSTGLLVEPVEANGESRGRKYSRRATNLRYDHLAFLLHARGAGTPDDGVGMFLNSAGQPEPIEVGTLSTDPEDRRSAGIKAWLLRLVGVVNAELSFEQISADLHKGLPEQAWVREVFDRYAVWSDRDGRMYRQDYTVSSDGSVAWSGTAEEVRREVTYKAINHRKGDPMKEAILAALNAAGVKTEGLDDVSVLAAYRALSVAPVEAKLTAANSNLAEIEASAAAAEAAEVKAMATELAANSGGTLTADDLAKLGKARLVELKGKAAPVLAGNSGGAAKSPYASYDPNEHFNVKESA